MTILCQTSSGDEEGHRKKERHRLFYKDVSLEDSSRGL
jgi:hypothetical protein